MPNDACRQKNQHPSSNEAKKCCKNDCVLIPPPHGFLMDRQTDGQTLKLKYCLRLIGERSKVPILTLYKKISTLAQRRAQKPAKTTAS